MVRPAREPVIQSDLMTPVTRSISGRSVAPNSNEAADDEDHSSNSSDGDSGSESNDGQNGPPSRFVGTTEQLAASRWKLMGEHAYNSRTFVTQLREWAHQGTWTLDELVEQMQAVRWGENSEQQTLKRVTKKHMYTVGVLYECLARAHSRVKSCL
ncbi:uncharacterized protein J3D65DRAFT_308733 [Phyllosticta citribraziliensis]|uniref:Uncharacterized protein n=1 Tax=Phyllosticta citribraziliensis TaxID=989973 RepID=A0ABR1LY10_9PEZI